MPFKSRAQMKKCWVEYNRAVREGRRPKWDCHEWSRETKNKLPSYSRSRRSRKRRRSRKSRQPRLTPLGDMSGQKKAALERKISKSRKIHEGPRGGKYVIVKGKKVYV